MKVVRFRRHRVAVGSALAALVCGGLTLAAVPGSAVGRDVVRADRPVAGTTCSEFPTDNYWRTKVDALPVHPLSDAWLSFMGTDRDLHPDFGPSFSDEPDFGIPITIVTSRHPKERVRFDFSRESDRIRYPVGPRTRIEGGRGSEGDRHAIIVERKTCRLYELYALRESGGRWAAGSGAVWSLRGNRLRRDGFTSADAAGLPILPGLLRLEEVRRGEIDHAIRFTTSVTRNAHIWPARHHAGSTDDTSAPPMGARFRLKASFRPSGMSSAARSVVSAMQQYGLVLADNGSDWFFQGEQNPRWPAHLVDELKSIPADQFEAVDTSVMMVSQDSGAAR
jgi:hypothetical protein